MKSFLYLTTILLTMSLVACNSSGDKHTSSLRFYWKVGGKIPDISGSSGFVGLAGPVAGVSSNRLLVGGGSNFPDGAPWYGGTKRYYKELYVFHKERDTLLSFSQKFSLPYKVAYSANCTTDSGIVVAGGENKEGASKKVWLLHWDQTKQEPAIVHLPDLPQPLSSGSITSINHVLYFAGGQNEQVVSDVLYRLDMNSPRSGWDTLSILPKPVTHTVLYAVTGLNGAALYLVGGRKKNKDSTSTLYKEAYRFDLHTLQWEQKASLPYALSAQTGVTWNDSTLLVFSGDQGKTFHETEVLIMKIAREKDSVKKERLIQEKNKLQQSHPGFSGTVLAYNTNQNEWRKVDSIPFPGQVTTTAIKWGDEVVIPCGEIRAGARTPDIVIGKILE